MADLQRMSELDAVNMMLMTIGEYKVNDLTNLAGRSDAAIAKDILNNTSRAVQSKGWTFNMDFDVVKTPRTMVIRYFGYLRTLAKNSPINQPRKRL